MKQLLLFGAGKSATALIDYLGEISVENQWQVTIADRNLTAWEERLSGNPFMHTVSLSVEEEGLRQKLIARADIVISLLPAGLHYLVALDCLQLGKHLLTASYIDEKINALSDAIKKKGLLFLCEMGLDPGIDHMSALQMIHGIQEAGGVIHSFRSHCGGLVAPESDDNPWHYKISWNPGNVVAAGRAGAVYRENSLVKSLGYRDLFKSCEEVTVDGLGRLAFYPNRDSLHYIPVYGLDKVATFIRTTLRHPDFCKGWQKVIELGLTDNEHLINTDGLTVAGFLAKYLGSPQNHSETSALVSKQFNYLGAKDNQLINKGECTAAAVLQYLIEQKWVLEPTDKDMIVMLHEIDFTLAGKKLTRKSTLIVKGQDNRHTAMAQTVGLPLGIAARLLLEGHISETGLQIPIVPGIYVPVLKALSQKGIHFIEKETQTGSGN